MFRARIRAVAAMAVTAAVLVACSPQGTPGSSPSAASSGGSAVPSASAGASASPSASASPAIVPKGQAVTIACGDVPCLSVTVVNWAFTTKYKGSKPVFDNKPKKGNVFVGVDLRYVATGPGSAVQPVEWTATVGSKMFDSAFPVNGPKPELLPGDLAAGKKVEGWIVFEVPAKGKVVLVFAPLHGAGFQVVLRSK